MQYPQVAYLVSITKGAKLCALPGGNTTPGRREAAIVPATANVVRPRFPLCVLFNLEPIKCQILCCKLLRLPLTICKCPPLP